MVNDRVVYIHTNGPYPKSLFTRLDLQSDIKSLRPKYVYKPVIPDRASIPVLLAPSSGSCLILLTLLDLNLRIPAAFCPISRPAVTLKYGELVLFITESQTTRIKEQNIRLVRLTNTNYNPDTLLIWLHAKCHITSCLHTK